MAHTVYFDDFEKRINSTKRFVASEATSYSTTFKSIKSNTSILNPTLLINGDISYFAKYSVAYIPVFQRYYFITDVSSINNGLLEVSMKCDVLATYRSDVGGYEGCIERTNDAAIYDVDIADSETEMKNVVRIGGEKDVSSGFSFNDYVNKTQTLMITYGQTGQDAIVSQQPPDFCVDDLLGSNSIWNQATWELHDPAKYLTALKILPYRKAGQHYNTITVALGNELRDIVDSNPILGTSDRLTILTASITISDISFQYNDFRKYDSNFTELTMLIPFVGKISIDPYYLSYDGISVNYYLDDMTGTGECIVTATSQNVTIKSAVIYRQNVNVAVDLPITIAQSEQSTVINDLTKLDFVQAVKDTAFPHGTYNSTGVNGSCGYFNVEKIYLYYSQKKSLARDDYKNELGYPAYKNSQISLNHYYKYKDSQIAIAGFEAEQNELRKIMNSGFYYE